MERGNLSILKYQLPQKQYRVLETMYVTYKHTHSNTYTHAHTLTHTHSQTHKHTHQVSNSKQNTKWHTGMVKVTLDAIMLEVE